MTFDPASAEALALLDELDTQAPVTLQPRRPTWGADLRAVPELPALRFQAEAIARIPGESIKLQLIRVNTTDNPAVLWALHVALDAAGIPPCVRPEQRIHTEQADFITVLADLLWIAKRYQGHDPLKKQMRRVLNGEPDTYQWHQAALWAYRFSGGKPYMLAKWLALTDDQRQQTATMPTRNEANRRRALPDQLETIREQLLTHALDRPDKSGRVKPDDLARDRTELVRLFVLLGRNVRALHEHQQAVEGVKTSARALRKKLDAIASIYGANRAPLAPPRRCSAL